MSNRDLSHSQGYGNTARDDENDGEVTFTFRHVGTVDDAVKYYEKLMQRIAHTEPDHMVTLDEFFKRRGIKI